MYEKLLIGLRGHAKRRGCDDRCPCFDAKDRGYATCSEELAEKAADAIEDLENKLNLWRQGKISRWISVTERLPKDGSDVLIYLKTAHDSRITAANYYKETWQDCVMGPLYLTEEGLVTHWMPLPEPPREGTDHDAG